jgi:hypothetical protein
MTPKASRTWAAFLPSMNYDAKVCGLVNDMTLEVSCATSPSQNRSRKDLHRLRLRLGDAE